MRPDIDTYFMDIAKLVSTRGTCARRKVGCVLVNSRRHILATGYNGPASGMPHCTEVPCPGASYKSGQGLDACEALHGEQSCLCQARDVYEIATAYVTTSPCVQCTKLFLGTSCRRIVFSETYPDAEKAQQLWEKAGREWHWHK